MGRNWGNFNLRLSTTGQIAAGAGYSTILGQTTDPALSTDNWHYIEVKVVVHDTAGSYEIRVDGVTVLSDTDVDTRGGDDDGAPPVRIRRRLLSPYKGKRTRETQRPPCSWRRVIEAMTNKHALEELTDRIQ